MNRSFAGFDSRTGWLAAAAVLGSILFLSGPSFARAAKPETPGRSAIGTSISAEKLSDEATVTRYAFARRAAPIRRRPHAGGRTNGRLRFTTTEGQALPYITLSRQTRSPGPSWLRIRVPGRPNGQTGWVRASALGSLRTAYGSLEVDRRKLRATLYGRHGEVLWRAPVGIGRPGLTTPKGRFWITERLRSIGGPSYGPFAFGTSAYAPHLTDWPGGGVIGIHGTDEPGLIPGRPSHGCIRLRNSDIRVLRRKLEIGTPLNIS